LSRPARMIVNNTPSKTNTPLCPEECSIRMLDIARDAMHCKVRGPSRTGISLAERLKL
jgi:hypothetical protein